MALGQVSTIPHFLLAETPAGLRRKMVLNSAKFGMFISYFDFSQLQNGKFICWYNMDLLKEASTSDRSIQTKGGD